MADGSARLGRTRKLYIDADGDIAIPTWVEAGKIQGLTHNRSRNVAEIEERDEDDVLVLPANLNREISFDLTFRPGNTTYDTIEAAFEAGTKIGVAVMSGDIAASGERGIQAEVYVTQFNTDEAHTSSAVAVTVRPAGDYATAPAFVEIA